MLALRVVAICAGMLPFGAALSAETLGDVRADLSRLAAEINSLRGELSATGSTNLLAGDVSTLARIETLEATLSQLIAKTEQLDIRINLVVRDGTNRLDDLNFRICDLDPSCDIATIGSTAVLGGVEVVGPAANAVVPEQNDVSLAIGEQTDFERAEAALISGDFRSAADQFAAFIETYPGGPLATRANLLRGDALAGQGDMTPAARAYLDAFSGAPSGPEAAPALYKLGTSLANLGQMSEACVTLGEVTSRFASAPEAAQAATARLNMGCE